MWATDLGAVMAAEELLALAGAGGAALVGAVAQDAWGLAKTGFVRLLGRGDQARENAVTQQLERTRGAVEAAGADGDRVRAQHEALWTGRLEDLLIERPAAAAELEMLVRQVAASVGVRSVGHVVQHVTASGNARQAVLGHGSQVNTFGTAQERADG
ncbi:hypothetical protein ABZ436_17770 [Micromonospora matsumotoense]|uniref:hypothetical protein n=1 Tax=Micromonospora matsumotoense TaxID=121616 RepID=UPI0034007352